MKLRKKIGMFFIFACIVPVGIMLAILLNQNAANIREVNKKEVERTVALVNKIAKQELEKGFISLDYLKNVSVGQEDSYQTQNALRDIKLNSANFVRVYIIDETGQIDVYPKDGKVDDAIKTTDWYKKAKTNNKLIYAHPKTEDSYIVTVSKSLVKGGISIGVVAVDIDLKLAFSELENSKTGSISNYAILDRNTGNIIFPNVTDFNAGFINELIVNDSTLGKTEVYKTKDKGNVSYYKEIVEGTDWLLVGEFSVSALKVTYEASRNILIVSLGIIAFLSLFSVFIFESIMVSPLVQVKEKFRQASTGNFGTRIFVDSNDEIGDLASEFNSLMKKISKKVKTIEEGISKGLSKSQIAADIELDEATAGFVFEKIVPKFDFKSNEAYAKREIQPKSSFREESKTIEKKLSEEVLLEDENFDNPIVEEDENFKKHQRELIHRTFDEWRSEYFKTLEEKKKKSTTSEGQEVAFSSATDFANIEDEIL